MSASESLVTINPFSHQSSKKEDSVTGLVSVEQYRAVAEIQAAMMIARTNPRNPVKAMDFILMDCTRQSLAEVAVYQYSRGGTDVSGPSIRLAENIARRWGNIQTGIKEISRQNGYSDCQAYAWDMETGYKDIKEFQVKHWRDKKNGGGYQLTDERDIYELIANMGARRKRACIQAVIPGEVFDAAVNQCDLTLKSKVDITPERIKSLVDKYNVFHVTPEQIEKRIQRRLDAITPALLVQLGKIYNSLKDGMSVASDWFDVSPDKSNPNEHLSSMEKLKAKVTPQKQDKVEVINQQTGEISQGKSPTPGASKEAGGNDNAIQEIIK